MQKDRRYTENQFQERFFTYDYYVCIIYIVDCQWNSWGSYSACSKTCGGGTKTKSRTKSVDENSTGSCSGSSTSTTGCNAQECPGKFPFLLPNVSNFFDWFLTYNRHFPFLHLVDCQWDSWEPYSACSKTCGGGTKTKSRTKSVVENSSGSCSGSSTYTKACNAEECPSKSSVSFTKYIKFFCKHCKLMTVIFPVSI